MATIIHFDISADDTERAKKFYSELFGWKFDLLPGPTPYYLIATKDLEGKPGTGGGMAKRTDPRQGIVNFIGVASIDQVLEKLKKLGGKVLQEKQVVPGYGLLAICTDTENNTIGLFEEIQKEKPAADAGAVVVEASSDRNK